MSESSHREPTWSSRVEPIDRKVLVMTAVLALVTVWAASALVSGFYEFLLVGLAWSFAAAVWSMVLKLQGRDRVARMAAGALLIGVVGITIYELRREEGQTHLVTGFVGVLADSPAGLIHVRSGEPPGRGHYERLSGTWFRWFPY